MLKSQILSNQLLDLFRNLIRDIERGELETIDRAAKDTSDAIARGNKFYIYDRGHLLNYELFNRAGGPALLRPLELTWPDTSKGMERELEDMRQAVEQSCLRPGDVLMLGSVSGRAANLIELAIQAQAYGVRTIAVTALSFTMNTPSQHPNGKRLFEVCDYVLDIHTSNGDSSLVFPGIEEKVLPTSGVTSAIVAWCFVAHLIEHLMDKGISPSIYRSVSLPGGIDQINATNKRFQDLGY